MARLRVLNPLDGLLGAVTLRDDQLVLVGGDARGEVLILGDRIRESLRQRELFGRELRCGRDELRDVAKRQRRRARDAVDGRVRIGVSESIGLAVRAGIDLQGDALAGTHEVAVDEVAVEAELLSL